MDEGVWGAVLDIGPCPASAGFSWPRSTKIPPVIVWPAGEVSARVLEELRRFDCVPRDVAVNLATEIGARTAVYRRDTTAQLWRCRVVRMVGV